MIKFVPFDPATKMSEATVGEPGDGTQRIVKGASAVVIGLAQPSPTATAAANELEAKGFRVLAVAVGSATAIKLAGLSLRHAIDHEMQTRTSQVGKTN